jgi:transposase
MAVKLNEEKVREIVRLYYYGKEGRVKTQLMQELADRFDVSIATIHKVVNRKIWADIWRR